MISNDKELPATKYLPYTAHLDEFTCSTIDGDATQTIQLSGVPFETMASEDINGLTREWFAHLTSIGAKSTRACLWTHMFRRKLRYDLSGIEYDNYFSTELNRQYGERQLKKDFFVNEVFISPVFRPAFSDAERFASRLSRDVARKSEMRTLAMEEVEKITKQLMVGLKRYHPVRLGAHEVPDPDEPGETLIQSDLARFYSRILNGDAGSNIDIKSMSIRYAIQKNDISFDGDIVEIAGAASTRYAAILSIKAPYGAEKVRSSILHGLLRLDCEFLLSQSLTFMQSNKAEKFLNTQIGHIESTSNNEIQLKELREALALLQAGKFGMCEHEFILTLYGDSIAEVSRAVSLADDAMSAKNLIMYRENRGGLITQYFSMLPANFKMKRIRAMPISTLNFVSFFPMHNFMTGNAQGSQWGMPLAMFETTSGAPYFVNYHVSRKQLLEQGLTLEYEDGDDEDPEARKAAAEREKAEDASVAAMIKEAEEAAAASGASGPTTASIVLPATPREKEQRKDSGNYIAIGPNGSGKTVVQTLLRALTRKKHMNGTRPYKSFAFDKDNGQEIFINALGGRYFRFELGTPANINLFSLPNNERSYHFIAGLTIWCANRDKTYNQSASDESRLYDSIREVYSLPPEMRRFARMRDTLPQGGKGSLFNALEPWTEGRHRWILNSKEDRFDLTVANDFGFDMTSFLDDEHARTPILSYIKHKIDSVAPGSPYSMDIDEASHALKDEFFRNKIIDVDARTIRKKEGVIGLGVQNASDITEGPLAATLSNQFPTMFIFPNPSADPKHYMGGLKLTKREFDLVQSGMLDTPGKFLLRKGIESVVVKADLSGMNDMLSVLSGSADNVPIVRDLIEQLGPYPEKWLPEFFKRRA